MNKEPLHLSPLAMDLGWVSAGSRFFYIKLLQAYGANTCISHTVRELAESLGVSDHVIKQAIRDLEARRLLAVETIRLVDVETSKPREGAPRRTLVCQVPTPNVQLRRKTKPIPQPPPMHHHKLIESLLNLTRSMPSDEANTAKSNTVQKESHSPTRRRMEHHYPLTLSHRLTLMVLLRYADPCGVVRQLSLSDLVRLTRTPIERVESDLTKLKATGYIRSNIPGISHATLFGVTNGMYFLNLQHPAFGEDAYPAVIVVADLQRGISENHIHDAANVIRETANGIRYDKQEFKTAIAKLSKNRRSTPESRTESLELNTKDHLQHIKDRITLQSRYFHFDESFPDISKFFAGEVASNRVDRFLQANIARYASELLSDAWGSLDAVEEHYKANMIETIANELHPNAISKLTIANSTPEEAPQKDSGEGTAEDYFQQLAAYHATQIENEHDKDLETHHIEKISSFIYYVALTLAQHIQRILDAQTQLDMSCMQHVILPPATDTQSVTGFALCSRYKDIQSRLNQYVLVTQRLHVEKDSSNLGQSQQTVTFQTNITHDDKTPAELKYRYGLLSKTKITKNEQIKEKIKKCNGSR